MRYRVRQGYTFGAYDQHTAGAVVELSEAEAGPFLDKLEPAEEEGGPEGDSLDTVSSEPDAPVEPEPDAPVEPEPDVPKAHKRGKK